MRPILISLSALLITAAAPPAPALQPSAEEEALLKRAVDRGALIFAYDRAAWVASDEMMAKVAKPAERIGGWVVDGPPAAPTVIFFDKDEANPKAVFVVAIDRGRIASAKLLGPGDDRSLSADRLRLIAARAAAVKKFSADGLSGCSDGQLNTVVLPPERPSGPVLVYILSAQTETDYLPFGGHYLIEVDSGGKAGRVRKFTNSCISLPLNPPHAKDEVSMGLVISHLLDPVPTEIHVFSALAAVLPVRVITTENRKVWLVEPPRITLVERLQR